MDRRILTLMLAVMSYVNSKDIPKNPFVRSFAPTQEEHQAYENMLYALEDCQEFYPELEKMLDEIMTSEASQE